MSVREKIDEALKSAQKAREAERVSTLRLVRAAIQADDIARRGEGRAEASDADILQILARMVKQREESATAFEAGKRPELAAKERAEIAVIREFMPRQMDEAEIRAAAAAAIGETGASGMRDMGKVIGRLKEQYAGQMDFSKASGIVKSLLG
ncbi:MAG: glutamyl-tRNA amidotransferase [Rhizobiales bacterium 65-79]|jgi:uncharacterized protein YqeY|nr:GatB/YqeY domain-containing protein [Hyphomicrobiales bacterium]OJU00125.1 MAG: glutamyl-tRNA amidotransferase [Rhizobiales bacterium 65-79]